MAKRSSAVLKMQVSGPAARWELQSFLRGGWLMTGIHSSSCGLSAMLQRNLSADCSGKTTAFMKLPGVHTSSASGRASLKGVDVRHVGDRFASSP